MNQVRCAPARTVIPLQRHTEGLGQGGVRRMQGWSAEISTTVTLLLVDGGMVRWFRADPEAGPTASLLRMALGPELWKFLGWGGWLGQLGPLISHEAGLSLFTQWWEGSCSTRRQPGAQALPLFLLLF